LPSLWLSTPSREYPASLSHPSIGHRAARTTAPSLAPRAWPLEPGPSSLAPRAWPLEPGPSSLAPRAWPLEPGPSSPAPRAGPLWYQTPSAASTATGDPLLQQRPFRRTAASRARRGCPRGAVAASTAHESLAHRVDHRLRPVPQV